MHKRRAWSTIVVAVALLGGATYAKDWGDEATRHPLLPVVSSPGTVQEVSNAPASAESGDAIDHNRVGMALANKGALDGAIRQFQQALNLDPNDATAHDNLGVAPEHKGDVDGAIHQFYQALSLNPDDGKAHYDIGLVLLRYKGDVDGAIRQFRRSLNLNPDDA